MVGGFGNTPNIVSVTDTPKAPFILSGEQNAIIIQAKILSTTVDSGNTGQTNVLRSGLTMAQYTSGDNINKWGAYNDGGSNGMATAQGFLWASVNMQNSQGTAQDTWALIVIGGGCLIEEDQVIGLDANGKTDLAYRFLWSTTFENS